VTGFLDVLLRGAALAGQALAVGGVCFLFLVLRAVRDGDRPGGGPSAGTSLALIAAGAVAVALAQAGSVALHLAALADERGWPLAEALGTAYVRAAGVRIAAGIALALAAGQARRSPSTASPRMALLVASAVLTGASAWLSHAAARLDGTRALLAVDAVHQLAASAWIGGLAHLVVAAFRSGTPPWPAGVLARFSALALCAVGALIAAGVGLAAIYVDGVGGLIGTSYGVMVLVKVAMLAALLALGGANFRAVRRLAAGATVPIARVQRFVEVELGLGVIVLFAAASLTSLPPAADVVADRATFAEVATRFTPRWPTFRSPSIDTMPVDDREAPRTAEDRAWSEYNHHMAGLFVVAMGVLAMLHGLGVARWARHWPLVFLGLAGFMLVRNDPGSWPLGPEGFWEGFGRAEVLQHRVFVVLVVGFGLFEWAVRTGRVRSPGYARVFPLLCVVGGGLLLTHSHALANVKQEFLTEVTHAPLGLLALAAGWGRWLELRLAPPDNRLPGRLWSVPFTLIGVLLLLYRES